jgi:hypothetical protein
MCVSLQDPTSALPGLSSRLLENLGTEIDNRLASVDNKPLTWGNNDVANWCRAAARDLGRERNRRLTDARTLEAVCGTLTLRESASPPTWPTWNPEVRDPAHGPTTPRD